jgi:hypothetical protein
MTISGNLPPYYPQEPLVFDADNEEEKIQSLQKPKPSVEEKPKPKLNDGGLNYVW